MDMLFAEKTQYTKDKFIEVCKTYNYELVEEFLTQGELDLTYKDKITVLKIGLRYRRIDLLRILLNNIDYSGDDVYTTLIRLIESGCDKSFLELLQEYGHRCDLSANENALLDRVLQFNMHKAVAKLLKYKAVEDKLYYIDFKYFKVVPPLTNYIKDATGLDPMKSDDEYNLKQYLSFLTCK